MILHLISRVADDVIVGFKCVVDLFDVLALYHGGIDYNMGNWDLPDSLLLYIHLQIYLSQPCCSHVYFHYLELSLNIYLLKGSPNDHIIHFADLAQYFCVCFCYCSLQNLNIICSFSCNLR